MTFEVKVDSRTSGRSRTQFFASVRFAIRRSRSSQLRFLDTPSWSKSVRSLVFTKTAPQKSSKREFWRGQYCAHFRPSWRRSGTAAPSVDVAWCTFETHFLIEIVHQFLVSREKDLGWKAAWSCPAAWPYLGHRCPNITEESQRTCSCYLAQQRVGSLAKGLLEK